MSEVDSGSFSYANPRTIRWGPGCVWQCILDELRRLNLRRVFVITTPSVAANPVLAAALQERLGDRYVGRYASTGQHAPAASIAEAVAAVAEARPDALISFGGGSPIDATKAVAFALATGLDFRQPDAASRARAYTPRKHEVLPHLAIPTTLSVAELSSSAGFSTQGEREKVGLRAASLLPAVVFYDAELTRSTPIELWLATGIRAVDHAVETILAAGSHPFSDTLALEGLRRLRHGLLATRADPGDLAARTESQLGAWFAYTLPGEAASGLSHTLGKRIGSRHGIPHGVTSCLLLPHVMRYLLPRSQAAQARIAEALGVDVRGVPIEQAAGCAATAVEELVGELGLPRHLSAYGLSDADLETAARPVASPEHPLEALVDIYRAAR